MTQVFNCIHIESESENLDETAYAKTAATQMHKWENYNF